MTFNDLKSLFLSYCRKEADIPDKQLFGLEYENFVFVPNNDRNGDCFLPLPVDGDDGVFGVLKNLVKLTKNSESTGKSV